MTELVSAADTNEIHLTLVGESAEFVSSLATQHNLSEQDVVYGMLTVSKMVLDSMVLGRDLVMRGGGYRHTTDFAALSLSHRNLIPFAAAQQNVRNR